MKLYTRTGDDGTTGLLGGTRVSKNCTRLQACGTVDELNGVLGWTAVALQSPLQERAQDIQRDLFSLGTELATSAANSDRSSGVWIHDDRVRQLEAWIDEADGKLPPLRNFILPGGCEAGARLHVVRSVCRRGERAVVALQQQEQIRALILCYLNRLSDLLFVWARLVNHAQAQPEIIWQAPGPDR